MCTGKYHELSRNVLHECIAALMTSDISCYARNNRFIICTYVASIVSMVTVPMDIENALCNIMMCDMEKYQHSRKCPRQYTHNRHISTVWHNMIT